MATQTIPRDLGLDLRKLPDLTDSATRKRLSPAAIEAVLGSGNVTADLRPSGAPATTEQVGEAVCAAIG